MQNNAQDVRFYSDDYVKVNPNVFASWKVYDLPFGPRIQWKKVYSSKQEVKKDTIKKSGRKGITPPSKVNLDSFETSSECNAKHDNGFKRLMEGIKANQQMSAHLINNASGHFKNMEETRASLERHLKSIANFWSKIHEHQLSQLPLKWHSYAFATYDDAMEHGQMAETAPMKFAKMQKLALDDYYVLKLQEESKKVDLPINKFHYKMQQIDQAIWFNPSCSDLLETTTYQ